MKYLSKSQMEKLSTKRLLAYKKKKLANPLYSFCRTGKCFDSMTCNGREHDAAALEYEQAYYICKEILSTREHI